VREQIESLIVNDAVLHGVSHHLVCATARDVYREERDNDGHLLE
jgi:hypothetical protein